jgi:hypothetical protein
MLAALERHVLEVLHAEREAEEGSMRAFRDGIKLAITEEFERQ